MAVGLYSGVSGLALGIGLYRNVSGLWGGASGLIDGFGGADPYAGASLYLNFLDPTLDSRITFSRGTNATLIDSTGKLTYAPNNTVTNSVGPTFSTGGTASTVAGAAPDGTNAVRLTKTDATTPRYSAWSTVMSSQSNTAYVVSAYFKYDGFNTTVSLEYNNTINWGIGWVATFSVTAAGITADAPSLCTSGVQAVGGGWFRVWAAFTTTTVTSASNPTILSRITGGNGTTVLVAWGQLEAVTYQTTPSTYVATTASAYYGPRFDYDPVTLAPRGLLIEEARTNLLTYSQDWTNAAWSKTNITVTAAATASPDGTVNAQRLQATATAVTNNVSPSAVVAATAASFSVYVKQGTGATTANSFALRNVTTATTLILGTLNYSTGVFTYSVGSTGVTAINVGNGWWRLVVTATSGITSGDSLAGYVGFVGGAQTAGDHLFAYGAQLEAGSFATSYIPTVASTVTRNADVATMTGTNFSSWYNQSEGALVADFTFAVAQPNFSTLPRFVGTIDSAGLSPTSGTAITGYQRIGGVNQMQTALGTSQIGMQKAGIAYGATSCTALNGTAGSSVTGSTAGSMTQFILGIASNSFHNQTGQVWYRTIAYFNTRLPNAQLQTLTAPSLATTLSLDFTSGSYNVGF